MTCIPENTWNKSLVASNSWSPITICNNIPLLNRAPMMVAFFYDDELKSYRQQPLNRSRKI